MHGSVKMSSQSSRSSSVSSNIDIVNLKGTLTVDSMTASIVMTGCHDNGETDSSSDEECVSVRERKSFNGVSDEGGQKHKDSVTRFRSRPVSNNDEDIAQSIISVRESIKDDTVSGSLPNRLGSLQCISMDDEKNAPRNRLLSDEEVQDAVQRNLRFNPFNKHSLDADSMSVSSDLSRNTSVSDCISELDEDVIITEDYFSLPEGHLSEKSIPDLKLSIQHIKDRILNSPEHSKERRNLVKKLVHLRLKLAELKETPTEDSDIKPILGHKFTKKSTSSSKHYCERCNTVIWGMLQTWYKCSECGYTSHSKCLNHTLRPCASIKVSESPVYVESVCPELSLSTQNYKCYECRAAISYYDGYGEPRLCDYSGSWYCQLCHWNDSMVIPARILHNWDFEPRKVCRASKQFLRLMSSKAVLKVQDVNPTLFSFVEELNEIKRLREEILFMKKYFLSCKSALESKLLLQLRNRQHFVENSNIYSIQDLCDTEAGILLPELKKIHESFACHITKECQLCQAKGFLCELCDSSEFLFPFMSLAEVCQHCYTVLHRICLAKKDYKCPKCQRREKHKGLTDHRENVYLNDFKT